MTRKHIEEIAADVDEIDTESFDGKTKEYRVKRRAIPH